MSHPNRAAAENLLRIVADAVESVGGRHVQTLPDGRVIEIFLSMPETESEQTDG